LSYELFSDCTNLKSVIIPNGVTEIKSYAFGWDTNLTDIIIPTSVKQINNPFDYCPNLTVTCYGDSYAESYVTQNDIASNIIPIVSIALNTLPDKTTYTIGNIIDQAGCSILINYEDGYSEIIKLPNYVNPSFTMEYETSTIGTKIVTVTCQGKTTSFEITVIEFDIRDGVLVIYHGNGGNVIIPDGVTAIGNWVFGDCLTLTSIEIPSSVQSIGTVAFSQCYNLTDVTVNGNITSIGQAAFQNCFGLKNIQISGNAENIGSNAFAN
jgi:hypothetical protein